MKINQHYQHLLDFKERDSNRDGSLSLKYDHQYVTRIDKRIDAPIYFYIPRK